MAKSLRNSTRNIAGALLFVCVIFGQWTLAGSGGPYVLEWTTIDGGGGTSSGGGFVLSGTIGQHDAGTVMTGGSFSLTGGFWPGMQGAVCFVDLEHFATFAEYWLMTGTDLPADFYMDEYDIVNLDDLDVFLDYWLWYCPPDWPLK